MKIFLLEDDYLLNKIIKESLQNHNFIVTSVDNGYKAADIIFTTKFDIYILDLNVNGFSGYDILQMIRKIDKQKPIIIISSEIGIESIKKSYDFGCNDYIKKPFDFEELLLRIDYHKNHIYPKQTLSKQLDLGNGLSFEVSSKKLFKLNQEIDLTHKEKLLLSSLVENINCVVSTQYIHEYVWDGKEIETVSIRSTIHKLNKKLKTGMIVNVRGVGYKLLTISQ
jgi:two-component system, OmpR family, response regulator QseB